MRSLTPRDRGGRRLTKIGRPLRRFLRSRAPPRWVGSVRIGLLAISKEGLPSVLLSGIYDGSVYGGGNGDAWLGRR